MEQTNLYSMTIPLMMKSLKALSAILDKAMAHAETKGSERRPAAKQMENLLADRLVFDQFPLIQQIQIACDNAKGAVGRLAEIEVPKFEDNEKTYEEIKARIEKTLKVLEDVKPEQIAGKENVQVIIPYFANKYFTGFDYVTSYLIPNFYFHVTTAYSILRKNGVDVGKNDFTGELPLKSL